MTIGLWDPLEGLEAKYQEDVDRCRSEKSGDPKCPSCGGDMRNVDCWLTCYDECIKCGWTFCEG
jgi:hypothetical protein